MVTFKKWLIKTIKDNCCLLNIRHGTCEYSIPYEKPENESFFDDKLDTISLQNLITNNTDNILLDDVFNVEIYSINQYELSRKRMGEHIDNKYSPILSHDFQTITRDSVLNLMFLNGITLNYMKIMDFMGYKDPVDFSKVKFVGIVNVTDEDRNVAIKNFSAIVNKRKEIVLRDMINVLGHDDSSEICSDIEKNVSDFILGLKDVPIGKFQEVWPTLLNPSPYYFQPRVASNDG